MFFDVNSWKKDISDIVNQPFDASEAHFEMAPYRKINREIDIKPIHSAVGIHFYFAEEPIIILIERPITMRKHAGQIAFPGGKKDIGDHNLIKTALRESNEEIGISIANLTSCGSLTKVYIPVTNYLIHSFIFLHDQRPKMVHNPEEVKEIFEVKLSEILLPETKTIIDIKQIGGITLKNVPCFLIQNKIIWGATSLLLNELKYRISQFHRPVV